MSLEDVLRKNEEEIGRVVPRQMEHETSSPVYRALLTAKEAEAAACRVSLNKAKKAIDFLRKHPEFEEFLELSRQGCFE
jgi:hypothetical protein